MVLDRYHQERKQLPQRVVLHKTSRFEPAERAGFEQALAKVGRYDLVALRDTSDVRLIRAGQYPPLRGTMFQAGDVSYLYTSGYLAHLGRYPHGHVPSPLQVADHVGDTARADLLRELMVLTKMNWNSANPSGLLPITLRFARLVGDILREVPPGADPSAEVPRTTCSCHPSRRRPAKHRPGPWGDSNVPSQCADAEPAARPYESCNWLGWPGHHHRSEARSEARLSHVGRRWSQSPSEWPPTWSQFGRSPAP